MRHTLFAMCLCNVLCFVQAMLCMWLLGYCCGLYPVVGRGGVPAKDTIEVGLFSLPDPEISVQKKQPYPKFSKKCFWKQCYSKMLLTILAYLDNVTVR